LERGLKSPYFCLGQKRGTRFEVPRIEKPKMLRIETPKESRRGGELRDVSLPTVPSQLGVWEALSAGSGAQPRSQNHFDEF